MSFRSVSVGNCHTESRLSFLWIPFKLFSSKEIILNLHLKFALENVDIVETYSSASLEEMWTCNIYQPSSLNTVHFPPICGSVARSSGDAFSNRGIPDAAIYQAVHFYYVLVCRCYSPSNYICKVVCMRIAASIYCRVLLVFMSYFYSGLSGSRAYRQTNKQRERINTRLTSVVKHVLLLTR